MRKIGAVAWKELKQIRRDPLSLIVLIGLPSLMLVLFGYAIDFDVEHVQLAVVNRDPGAASRELLRAFQGTGKFDLVAFLPPGADPEWWLERRRAQAVLILPEDLSRELAAGRTARVQLLLDGTDSTAATTILGYAQAVVAAAGARLATEALGLAAAPAAIDYRPRVWYNPELESSHFLVPGLIGFIMMLTAVLSTALSVVREKERGTLEQLRVAPIGTFELLLGKTLPYLGTTLLAVVLILAGARVLFGLEVRGSYLDLFLATLVFLFGALGWGLFVSTIADNQATAFQIGIFSALLPTMILSGFVFPIRNMPLVLQLLSHLVPARYYLVVLRGVVLKGADLAPYWDQMAAMAIYAVAVLSLAAARFARGTA
jgi:ABC-2 type transport system permease protein